MKRVEVLLPVALDRSFTYAVPDHLDLEPGDIVEVPLGGGMQDGVVWGPGDPAVPAKKLKRVEAVYDLPKLTSQLMRFVDWVARYTVAPIGMVLRIALRGARSIEDEVPKKVVVTTGDPPARMTDARERVLEAASDNMARSKAELAREAGVSPGVIDGLVKDGALRLVDLPPEPIGAGLDPDFAAPELNDDQKKTADALVDAVRGRKFATHLLEGVTGAGKTETYLEAAAEAIRAGRQVLILLPEIALTRMIMDRVAARFGAAPGEWHSTVSPKRRARTWQGAASGETQIVVGARSALFLPFRDLGLIIVDEEHDPGFKQEDTPVYHARDMAVVRGQISEAPVILV
jgi:primosomal protein N' (replication factor Y)